ncbi:MAG: PrsW family intramembrane metalloprotease [Clostridia bacterium]|nr:PrsW family intramembrane metalloprotease [Clostridia bacterium]
MDEYASLFSRGMKGSANGLPAAGEIINKAEKPCVPWLWLRVLALGLIIFSVTVFSFRSDGNSIDVMTAAVCGALAFNLAVLVFFYELYPKRDLSLLFLIFTVLAGGAVSCALISVGYEAVDSVIPAYDYWISLLWTGFWEELAKGAVAIAAILLLRKKNPFYCFLIGFAVGTGYSYFEDLGYILSYTRGGGTLWLVLMTVGRGLSCACSHAPWTGIICWAFARFKKPFINFRFWAVVLTSMVLHYFADIPFYVEELEFLRGLNFGWLIEFVVVASIWTVTYFMLKSSLKELSSNISAGQMQLSMQEIPAPALSKSQKLKHASNVTALLCALALAVINMAGCAAVTGFVTDFTPYPDGDFIGLIQCGLELKSDWSRPYNPEQEDFSYHVSEGAKTRAVQKDIEGEYEYYYYYYFYEDGDSLDYIAVKTDSGVYYSQKLVVYESYIFRPNSRPVYYEDIFFEDVSDDEEQPPEDEPAEPEQPEEPDGGETEEPAPQKIISYYVVKQDFYYSLISDYHYDIDKGFLVESGTIFEDLALAISLGASFAVISVGGITAVLILRKKAVKNSD